ncbi:SPOR domain-containing protein [Agaribacter flavus]|uniref:SPOR domain-containing protein n=1 Tax=Agaribacter flavus TaxID=1902781 RepID=A0ABV7FNA0_9ALTE
MKRLHWLSCFLLVSTTNLTACMSLSDIPGASYFGLEKNNADMLEESGSKVIRFEEFDDIDDAVETAEVKELEKLLANYRNEWEELKPAINRVLLMEEDLGFMIEHLGTLNTMPDYRRTFAVSETSTPSLAPELNSTSTENNNFQTPDSSIDKKFSGNRPIAQAVKPIMSAGSINASKFGQADADRAESATIAEIDKKFSSLPNNAARNERQLFSAAANPDKSMGNEKCEQYDSVSENSFAIHLASYSKQSSVNDGWKNLSQKLEDVRCNKFPIVEKVVVNDKTFYSLRMGPFNDIDEAKQACSTVRQSAGYCGVVKFGGERL